MYLGKNRGHGYWSTDLVSPCLQFKRDTYRFIFLNDYCIPELSWQPQKILGVGGPTHAPLSLREYGDFVLKI